MRQIVNDWIRFCSNEVEFPDDYFFTLFMENVSNEEMKKIFSFFPNKENLFLKMNRFQNDTKNYEHTNDISLIEEYLKKDFIDRRPIFEKSPLLKKLGLNLEFKYYEDNKFVYDSILNDIWSQQFRDFVRGQKIVSTKPVFELYNAMFGLTYDFDFTLYLFEPLLDLNYSMENLYLFKKMGGIYAIDQNSVCFSVVKK